MKQTKRIILTVFLPILILSVIVILQHLTINNYKLDCKDYRAAIKIYRSRSFDRYYMECGNDSTIIKHYDIYYNIPEQIPDSTWVTHREPTIEGFWEWVDKETHN